MISILALEELVKENELKITLQKRQLADHESGENKLSRMAQASTENTLEVATDLLSKYKTMLDELLAEDRTEVEEKERLFALAQRKKYFDAQDSRIKLSRELSSDQKLEVMRIIEELPDEIQFEDEKLFEIATKSLELSLPDLKELSEKLDAIKKDFQTLLKDAENGDLQEIGTINFLIPIVVLHFHVLLSNIKQGIDDSNNKALQKQQDILNARNDEKEKLLNTIMEYEKAVKAREVKRAEAEAKKEADAKAKKEKEADDIAKKELAKNMENTKEVKIEKIEKPEVGVITLEGTEEGATPEAIEGETPEVAKDEVAIQKDIEGKPLYEIEEGTITDAQLLEGTTLPEEDEEKIIPEAIESEEITVDETTSEEIEDEEITVEEDAEGTPPEEIEDEEITVEEAVEEIEEEIKEIDIAAITKAIGEIDKKAIPEVTELKFSGFPKFEDWWIRELWMSHQAYFALFKWKAIINNLCITTEQKKAWSIIFDRWVFIKKLLNDKGELAYNYNFAFDSLLVTYSEIEEEIDHKNILSMELIIKEITKKEDFTTTTSYHNVDTPYLKYKKVKLAPKKEKKEIEIELEK